MASAPSLRARTSDEPEPDLTPTVVVHRAIRQDLRRLAARVDQVARHGEPAAATRGLCRYTAFLLEQIRASHRSQDDITWPVLAAAAGQAIDLEPFSDDYEAIEAAVSRASKALEAASIDRGGLAALRAAVGQLRDMVDECMADEDRQVIPVMRRYLRAETYQWCERQIQRRAIRPGRWLTAPWLARHSRPDELHRLVRSGGFAARLVLAATRPGYARLERRAFSPRPRPPTTPATPAHSSFDYHEEEIMTSRITCPGRRERPTSQSGGPDDDRASTATSTTTIIGLTGVQKIYRAGRGVAFPALGGVDLTISAGEMVAITGPSGSGKTTIINLIAGIDRPTVGTVTVAGSRLDQMNEEQLAVWRGRTIGIVFQFFQLMPTLTAAENATLPLDLARRGHLRERRAAARRQLAAVGLADRGDRLPLELSGGEQQRVAIARAMAGEPPVLLGDELTGNLDTGMAQEMFRLLQGINANGTTVIYVTHDPALAAMASRIVSVRDGLIVDDTGARP